LSRRSGWATLSPRRARAACHAHPGHRTDRVLGPARSAVGCRGCLCVHVSFLGPRGSSFWCQRPPRVGVWATVVWPSYVRIPRLLPRVYYISVIVYIDGDYNGGESSQSTHVRWSGCGPERGRTGGPRD
jgi:hypothetical protein